MALSRKCVKILVQVKTNTGHTQVLVMPSLIICVDLEKTTKNGDSIPVLWNYQLLQ